jgi:uncharacterized protein (TIGR04222 family)
MLTQFAIVLGVLIGALIVNFFLAWRFAPQGRDSELTEIEQIARLAGENRVAEAVAARLLAAGALVVSRRGLEVKRMPDNPSAAERSVLALPPPISVYDLHLEMTLHAHAAEQTLVSAGLMMTSGQRWRQRLLCAAPYLVAILLLRAWADPLRLMEGLPSNALGMAGLVLLVVLLVIFVLALGVNLWPGARPTAAGARALAKAQKAARSWLDQDATPEEVGFAVAVHGTEILRLTPWSAFDRLAHPSPPPSSEHDWPKPAPMA